MESLIKQLTTLLVIIVGVKFIIVFDSASPSALPLSLAGFGFGSSTPLLPSDHSLSVVLPSILPLKCGMLRCYPKNARELPQLVESKRFGEDVGHLPIRQNVFQFNFTNEKALVHKVIMHFYVLALGMEDEVLCELDAPEVFAIDQRRINNLHLHILQWPLEQNGLTRNDCRSLIFGLYVRQCNRRLLLATPRDRGASKREDESGCGSTIVGVSSPIGIHVAD